MLLLSSLDLSSLDDTSHVQYAPSHPIGSPRRHLQITDQPGTRTNQSASESSNTLNHGLDESAEPATKCLHAPAATGSVTFIVDSLRVLSIADIVCVAPGRLRLGIPIILTGRASRSPAPGYTHDQASRGPLRVERAFNLPTAAPPSRFVRQTRLAGNTSRERAHTHNWVNRIKEEEVENESIDLVRSRGHRIDCGDRLGGESHLGE